MASPAASPAGSQDKSVLPPELVRTLCERYDYDTLQQRLRDTLFTRHCPFTVDAMEQETGHVPVIYEDVRRAFASPATTALNTAQLRRAYTRAVYLLLRLYQDCFAYYHTFPTHMEDLFASYAMVHAKVVGWITAYAAATAPTLRSVAPAVRAVAEAAEGALPNPVYVAFMTQASVMGLRLRQHIHYNSAAITPSTVRPTLDNPKLVASQARGRDHFLGFLDRCDDWAAVWSIEAVPRFDDPPPAPRPPASPRAPVSDQ